MSGIRKSFSHKKKKKNSTGIVDKVKKGLFSRRGNSISRLKDMADKHDDIDVTIRDDRLDISGDVTPELLDKVLRQFDVPFLIIRDNPNGQDILSIANYRNVESISLVNSKVETIPEHMEFKYLSLENTGVKDIHNLNETNLQELTIKDEKELAIRDHIELPDLQRLHIRNIDDFDDIDHIEAYDLKELKLVSTDENKLDEIPEIARDTNNLLRFELEGHEITSFENKMNVIEELHIKDNHAILTVSGLAGINSVIFDDTIVQFSEPLDETNIPDRLSFDERAKPAEGILAFSSDIDLSQLVSDGRIQLGSQLTQEIRDVDSEMKEYINDRIDDHIILMRERGEISKTTEIFLHNPYSILDDVAIISDPKMHRVSSWYRNRMEEHINNNQTLRQLQASL